MPAPFLLDLSHTSHTRARTGIQRVARSLRLALGDGALGVTWDPYWAQWRTLEPWEWSNLHATTPGAKRGAQWPVGAKLRGRWRRLGGQTSRLGERESVGFIVPELFSPAVAAALPRLKATTRGPSVAVFHDAIALKLPEYSPPKTVARFPAYLLELLQFDGIAAISEDSRQTLLDYWRWAEVPGQPPVETIPLGVDSTPPSGERPAAGGGRPIVLTVGSIEARKNHVALLDACDRLWREGATFELRLIGLTQPETGRVAAERIRRLQSAGRPLRYDGATDEAELERAYTACAFTVYPSLVEGFGLPVLESVGHGKPCVCSARGALGEAARGGGCVALEEVTTDALVAAIRHLLASPAQLSALSTGARARKLRTWNDYASDLTAWMRTLRRRD